MPSDPASTRPDPRATVDTSAYEPPELARHGTAEELTEGAGAFVVGVDPISEVAG